MKRVAVIGGGSGIYALLEGLKYFLREHPESIDLTAIITMSDDGGSTGKLREDHKVLPVGDTLKAMMALSDFDDEKKYGPFVFDTLHKLFVDLRFSKGAFAGDNPSPWYQSFLIYQKNQLERREVGNKTDAVRHINTLAFPLSYP